MKKENLSDINVKFNKSLDIKNYEDYDEKIINFCDSMFSGSDGKITGNVIPLTSNFEEGDINTLETIIIEGISNSLNTVFSAGFINVKPHDLSEIDMPAEKSLTINIDYIIKNQKLSEALENERNLDNIFLEYLLEIKPGIAEAPNVWLYSENGIFKSYLLGIDIQFNFKFQIPKTNSNYEFTKIAEPSEDIQDIDGIQDGYRKMTQISFANYANIISENFGIQGAYFQKDTFLYN